MPVRATEDQNYTYQSRVGVLFYTRHNDLREINRGNRARINIVRRWQECTQELFDRLRTDERASHLSFKDISDCFEVGFMGIEGEHARATDLHR